MFPFANISIFAGVCLCIFNGYTLAVNVNGVILKDKQNQERFSGDESRDPNSMISDIVGYLTVENFDPKNISNKLLLETIIPPYNVSTGVSYPLVGTYQLLQGVKWVEKKAALRLSDFIRRQKTLSYNGRFILDAQVNAIVFGSYDTIQELFGKKKSQNFKGIKTLCERVPCVSLLPVDTMETFNEADFENLGFKSHFVYIGVASNIQLPEYWYYIHDGTKNTACPFTDVQSATMTVDTFDTCINNAMTFLDTEIQKTLQQAVADSSSADNMDPGLLSLIPPASFSFMREYKFYEFDNNSTVIAYKMLGSGKYAEVFLGKDVKSRKRVAVKKGASKGEYDHHKEIYDACTEYIVKSGHNNNSVPQGLPFVPIPKVLSTKIQVEEFEINNEGKRESVSKSVYAMEPLGPNLGHSDLRVFCAKFPMICYRDIALQILDRVYLLQQTGWIHADLKPHNLMFGLGENKKIIYLTDFGVMENLGVITSDYKPRTGELEIRGTDVFMSHQTNMGHQILWIDNYISVGYIIMYIMGVKLPWLHLAETATYGSVSSEAAKQHRYIELKNDLDSLCHGVVGGAEMKSYFEYLYTNKNFWEKPDINILKGFITRILLNSRDRKMNHVEGNTLYNVPMGTTMHNTSDAFDTSKNAAFYIQKFQMLDVTSNVADGFWNLVPVHCMNHPINHGGDLVPKIQNGRTTLYIEENALVRVSENQSDIRFTDVVVMDGTKIYYVMFLPGREKLLTTLCNVRTMPCVVITDNHQSRIAFGNQLSPYIHATISAKLFQQVVCEMDTDADVKQWAIKTRGSANQENGKGFLYANDWSNMSSDDQEMMEWEKLSTQIK